MQDVNLHYFSMEEGPLELIELKNDVLVASKIPFCLILIRFLQFKNIFHARYHSVILRV